MSSSLPPPPPPLPPPPLPPPPLPPPPLPPPTPPSGSAPRSEGQGGHRLPSEDDIQRILSSTPKGLEHPSPFRSFSISAMIGYIAGSAMVLTGLMAQPDAAERRPSNDGGAAAVGLAEVSDQRTARAVNLAGGIGLILLASICRHTKRLSSRPEA